MRCRPAPAVASGVAMAVALAVPLTMAACTTATGSTGSGAEAPTTRGTVAAPSPFTCPARATGAGEARPGPDPGQKLEVVTTVAPITSIVANVAGDAAAVTGIIPEGDDSHTYEPRPSSAKVLSSADVVFVNGLELEDPTRALAAANLKAGGQVIELGTTTIEPDQYLYDDSFPRAAGKPNPHLWTNPPMARCYAAIVASALAKADPANAATYRDNAARYEAKLDDLDRRMQEATSSLPDQNRALLTYHDAYAYFAAHYGWRVIGAIQVSSFQEPSPKEVAALIEQVEAERVPAIFGSEVFPSPVLEQIGRETGVTYVETLRDDDLPGAPGDAEHSFLGLLKYDFVTMVTSLGGDASGLRQFDASDVSRDEAVYPQ
jgi:ABC-type Zn uptake system ZnuABC Zn-binding protein ZnuA